MANRESSIAWAITSVAVAIVVAFVVVPEIKEWQARRALAQIAKELEAGSEAAASQLRKQIAESSRRTREAAFARDQAKMLRSGEQRVGGSVVRVLRKDGVPSYEQVLEQGRPIKCLGNKRI